MKFKTLKERYFEMMSNKISVSLDDLTDNEKTLIEAGFDLFYEKLEDIKILDDENKRISIELANLKSFNEDLFKDNGDDEDED